MNMILLSVMAVNLVVNTAGAGSYFPPPHATTRTDRSLARPGSERAPANAATVKPIDVMGSNYIKPIHRVWKTPETRIRITQKFKINGIIYDWFFVYRERGELVFHFVNYGNERLEIHAKPDAKSLPDNAQITLDVKTWSTQGTGWVYDTPPFLRMIVENGKITFFP